MCKKLLVLVFATILNVLFICSSNAEEVRPVSEQAMVEVWGGITGKSLSALKSNVDYPEKSDTKFYTDKIDLKLDSDNYGLRVRGSFVPPQTAVYTFWISSDNAGEFWLSSDESPENIAKEAYVSDWVSYKQWDKYASQKSRNITLEAGKKYYFEAFLKESTGGDHLAVGWSVGESEISIIGDDTLSSFLLDGDVTPEQLSCPVVVLLEDHKLRLSWKEENTDIPTYEYRVYRNDEYVASVSEPLYLDEYNDGGIGNDYYQVSAVYANANEGPMSEKAIIGKTYDYTENGLIGIYYNDNCFVNGVLERIDKQIDFNWGTATPANKINTNSFSVVWEGQISPLYSEAYEIVASTADNARIWIDGKLVFEKWDDTDKTTVLEKVDLKAGEKYDIKICYYETPSIASCCLLWRSTSQVQAVVPSTRLFPKKLEPFTAFANVWIGNSYNNLWSNPYNWSLARVPNTKDDVLYHMDYNYECLIDTDISVFSFYVDREYTANLYCNNKALNIAGDISIKYDCSSYISNSTLLLNGTTDQHVYYGTNIRFKDIIIDNEKAHVFFRNKLYADNFIVKAGSNIKFYPSVSLNINSMQCLGTPQKRINLGLAEVGEHWLLCLAKNGNQEISNVNVAYSNANSSDLIDGTNCCRDGGHNINWVFDPLSTIGVNETGLSGAVVVEGYALNDGANDIIVYVNGVEVPVENAGGSMWYSDGLLVEGQINTIEVVKGGETIYVKEIEYTPEELTGNEIVIRHSDGLLLEGCGGIDSSVKMLLDFDNNGVYESVAFSDGKFTYQFENAGEYRVSALIDRNKDGQLDGDNELNQTLIVKVVSVDFNGPVACMLGYERKKNDIDVTGVPVDDIVFTTTNNSICTITKEGSSQTSPLLNIYPISLDSPFILARYKSENGPIVNKIRLDVFKFITTATEDMNIVEQLGDDEMLLSAELYQYPHIAKLNIDMHIFVWGVTFEDSTIDKTISTDIFEPKDHEQMPIGSYSTEFSLITTKNRLDNQAPCHTIKIMQNGVQVGK